MQPLPYDSILVLSFGGPERTADVIPFLENVLRGKNVPRERMLEVAEHYYHFGGKSPINDLNRELIDALRRELAANGPDLPIYWGNRNWHPLLEDTLRQMRGDGRRRGLAYVTSAFSSYSGCRQYREDIAKAQARVEGAPGIDKLRAFYNHPGFTGAVAANVQDAFDRLPAEARAGAKLLFTAHSIPVSMAESSDYVRQLTESCRLVAEKLQRPGWRLVYQSRSGPPQQPWLEPDVNAAIRELASEGVQSLVISPAGFVTCHLEVLYDLDTEARQTCGELGIRMERASTPNANAAFVSMLGELIRERMGLAPARAIGLYGPNHDICPQNCCPAPERPTRPR